MQTTNYCHRTHTHTHTHKMQTTNYWHRIHTARLLPLHTHSPRHRHMRYKDACIFTSTPMTQGNENRHARYRHATMSTDMSCIRHPCLHTSHASCIHVYHGHLFAHPHSSSFHQLCVCVCVCVSVCVCLGGWVGGRAGEWV